MQLTTTPQAQAAKPIHAGVGLLLGLFSRLNLFALLPGNRFFRPDFLEAEEPGKVGAAWLIGCWRWLELSGG